MLVKMNDEIKYRGPDGEGFLVSNQSEQAAKLKNDRKNALVISLDYHQNLALGHRRLSILDLHPSASQPMISANGRYHIVFNGEIYNHAALRKELEILGSKFLTDHSDTEVILNAYECWGLDCLQKFNGMWAFCIWDKIENSFFFARDRAGKKPLYYTEFNNQFVFASELKSILVNKEIPKILDEKGVYDYLTYMMVPAPKTIFKNIYKLPAAHYLLIKPGQTYQPVCYWSPISGSPYLKLTEAEAAEGIREHLYKSAHLRMLADVEVGVLLSGGLDSSINLACLSKFATKPIKAFSVGFENKAGYTNEFEYARKAAKHFNAEYHELTLTEKDFFEFYPKMVHYQDEPIADTANIPIYYIAKKARENNVKVLLGGEGSDELFVGYNHWRIAAQFAIIFEGNPLLTSLTSFLHRHSPVKHKRLYYHSLYGKVIDGKPPFWGGTELRTEKEKNKILSKEYLNKIAKYSSFDPIKAFYYEFKKTKGLHQYDWMTSVDLRYRLPDLLLARLDRMLMAASIEGRNPFLDVNLIEFAMKLNPKIKTKNGIEKYILKKAFEGILPDEIIYRKKDSFTVPLNQLFQNEKQRLFAIEMIKEFNNRTRIFNNAFIESLIKGQNGGELWNIANLALWYNQYK